MGAHGHADHPAAPSRRLAVALVVSLAVLALEVAGALASNSLALLGDAGHVFTDVLALGLALFASRQAERPASSRHTYGFHRAGILAALVNASTLVLLAALILVEAYHRLAEPEPVSGGIMLVVATVGLLVNLGVARSLHSGSANNLNLRAAMAHVVGDALASVAVIVGAVALLLGGPPQIDPLLSIIVGCLIIGSAWSIGRETLNILMESAPPEVDVDRLTAEIGQVPGVVAVHDVHVWRVASHLCALSAHVRLDPVTHSESDDVLREIQRLAQHYGINHATVQVERAASQPLCAPGERGSGCTPLTQIRAVGDEHDHAGATRPTEGAPLGTRPALRG